VHYIHTFMIHTPNNASDQHRSTERVSFRYTNNHAPPFQDQGTIKPSVPPSHGAADTTSQRPPASPPLSSHTTWHDQARLAASSCCQSNWPSMPSDSRVISRGVPWHRFGSQSTVARCGSLQADYRRCQRGDVAFLVEMAAASARGVFLAV
jgi:hypothetical protein